MLQILAWALGFLLMVAGAIYLHLLKALPIRATAIINICPICGAEYETVMDKCNCDSEPRKEKREVLRKPSLLPFLFSWLIILAGIFVIIMSNEP